jgi:hypothetical protein
VSVMFIIPVGSTCVSDSNLISTGTKQPTEATAWSFMAELFEITAIALDSGAAPGKGPSGPPSADRAPAHPWFLALFVFSVSLRCLVTCSASNVGARG